MSAIEQAVAHGVPYQGDDAPGEPDAGSVDTAGEPAASPDPAEAGSQLAGSGSGRPAPPRTQPRMPSWPSPSSAPADVGFRSRR